MKFRVGDVVVNEYGHTGRILEINPPDEVEMTVFDYGISGDTDWCSLYKLREATEEDVHKAFNKPI